MLGSKTSWMLLAAAAAGGVAIVTAQQSGAGPYTAAQADAGRALYQANCEGCHAADLSGIGNAPALSDGLFMGSWGDKTPGDLVSFMQGAMPPSNPGGLGQAAYVNITAFILDYNGARPGGAALTADNKTPIRMLATGQARQVAQAGGRGGRAGRGGRGGANEPLGGRAEAAIPPTPRGLTVHGEVKNYSNITDAMLRNPSPNDWIMIRHDYHANNYSTLNQINRENVKDLQLQWVWAMNEGTNQAAPLVHDGTLFINNPGNIVQALNARTGDLIWENRPGPHLRPERAQRRERVGHGHRRPFRRRQL
jgi:alcohol dehydrogenase (cytochrome c)